MERYAIFAGKFKFAGDLRLSSGVVGGETELGTSPSVTQAGSSLLTYMLSSCLLGWHQVCKQTSHLTAPNLWLPLPDGSGLSLLNSESGSFSDWRLVLGWIECIAEQVLPRYGLWLQGEIWYQGKLVDRHVGMRYPYYLRGLVIMLMLCLSSGEESLDTGRLYADENGVIQRQTIKLCPGIAGAAARNDVITLQSLSRDELVARDGFGRNAFMLAAKFDSWAVLQQLLLRPSVINWLDEQTAPVNNFAELFSYYLRTGLQGMTAMHYLCKHPSAAATVQQYAATVAMLPPDLSEQTQNAADKQGGIPLTYAVMSRNKTMLTWLLQHSADPNGDIMSTPIMQAICVKDVTFLQDLLTAGATVHCRDAANKSPLNLAVELQHSEHLQLLVTYGANLKSHHFQFRHGCGTSQTVWHFVQDFPAGTSGAALKTAVARGLAVRRHLVVMALAAHVAPHLPRDVLHLICQYASLTL